MEEWGMAVFDYEGSEAIPDNVESMLAMKPDALFIFYDHGDEKGLVAQGGGSYIIDSGNVTLLKDRVVYTLACLWGKDGGWEAKRKGARAVHCYVEVVGFMTSALEEFQEAFNCGFKLLREIGPDFSRILKEEIAKMTELADQLMEDGNFLAAMWMNRNCASLRWYNDEASKPPESKCFWRRLAVKLFGSKIGWNLRKYLMPN